MSNFNPVQYTVQLEIVGLILMALGSLLLTITVIGSRKKRGK
jgi:hypothetical protein